MICTHTVRRLRPGTFDAFCATFRPGGHDARPGWVRFNMLRGVTDENEVVTFGFYDSTLEEMNFSQDGEDYSERATAIAPFVEEVIPDGVYEIVLNVESPG